MEVVGRGATVGHDHVAHGQLLHLELVVLGREILGIVCRHLEESLRLGAAVLGSHPLHAVGQQHHQAALPHPLGLAGGDELVDDALGGVAEVPELGLPQHQSVGVGHGVAQLEPEDAVLGQRAVTHRVWSLQVQDWSYFSETASLTDSLRHLIWVEVGQGFVGGLVPGLVVEDVMTLGESSSLHVLPGQSHVHSVLQKRTEGEGFSHGPVTLPLDHHLRPSLVDSLHSAVYLEVRGVGRTLGELLTNVGQSLLVDSSVGHLQRIFAFKKSRPRRVQPVLVEGLLNIKCQILLSQPS